MIVYLWLAAALIGAVAAAWNLRDAYADLRALDAAVLNGRRILNQGWVRREAVRLGIQATWTLIGVLALPAAADPVHPLAILAVATVVATTVNTILDAYERRTLRRIIGGQS